MASFCPGTPALHVSFTCVKYEPSQCWETHRKAFLSWELLFTWGMNWNSYWRAEGLSFGGNLKESRTHYKKREKKNVVNWDCGTKLCGVLLWILKLLCEHPVMLAAMHTRQLDLAGEGGSSWLGLSSRVCSYTGKEMGVRAWKSGSLIVSHLLGYFPAQSFLFRRVLFFKVMVSPKAMTLRTQYVTHRRAWPTGDRSHWCSVLWEWGTREDQHQS